MPKDPEPYATSEKSSTSEPSRPTKRLPPPVFVPPAARYGGGLPSQRIRDLNVMLSDLGLLRGRLGSHYTSHTRNGVSLLQQRLRADGYYSGPPHGSFDAVTRDALLADPDIPTTTK